MKDNRIGSSREKWDKIFEQMIFLWKETEESTCSKKNPYEDEYSRAYSEFKEKYGFMGEKLQTKEELEKNRKCGGRYTTVHFMNELSEYKEIYDKYLEEEHRLEQYRSECKDEAIDMLKKYFYELRLVG